MRLILSSAKDYPLYSLSHLNTCKDRGFLNSSSEVFYSQNNQDYFVADLTCLYKHVLSCAGNGDCLPKPPWKEHTGDIIQGQNG